MQGVVFMPQNPQQGSPPPNNTIASALTMDIDPTPSHTQSDSGIFSSANSTLEHCDSSDSERSSPERKYICPICESIHTSQHEFTLHIRSHNTDSDKGFTCRICHKVLSSSSSLDRHVLVHSGERPFHCRFCGDTFTTNGNMHRHMRTHKNDYESDASTDSGKEYNNNKVETKRRKCHESDNESQAYKCPVCERTDFDSIISLEAHLLDNHPDYPAKCGQCSQVFHSSKLMMEHREAVHNTEPKNTVSGFKDLTFVDFSSEKFPHIARYECEKNLHTATEGLAFKCKTCARCFPCNSSLEIHQKDCSAAGLDLSKPQLTDRDIRRNEFFSRLNLTPEKPQNETSTKLRQQLLAKVINNDSKDLADIQSIISMTTNGSLLQQLQAKTDLKDSQDTQEEESQDLFAVEFRKMKLRGEFPCRLCTAVFPNLRALKGHNRAHLNGNNNGMYRCNMCPHSSIDKAALIRHMRTHNGDRPYECSLCNYAFTTKANCERHLRNRHAKTTREEVKKSIIYHPSEDPTNEELNKLTKTESPKEPPKDTPKETFSNINDIIRNENLKSLKEHRIQTAPFLPYNFPPNPPNVTTSFPPKIQVKNLEELKEQSDEDLDDEPIDLSKKKTETPEDLSKKTLSMFAHQFSKTKIDPAALYASLYRNSFAGFSGWPPLPINPLLFPTLQPPLLQQEEMKERFQRYQMCGGSLIADNFKNFQPFSAFKQEEKKAEDMKPLSLNVDTFAENFKLQSPVPKPDLSQSPNSVKMVIKNGVLMPKQKQRRYRTERPFTCEHCSARFTLRSNMERHIKQQHPQFWSQRQRGISNPGRKPSKSPFCDLSIPNYEPKQEYEERKDVKFALLAQHLQEKKEEDDDCALVIDENEEKEDVQRSRILEEKLKELHAKQAKKGEEDLVSVSRLLDNASQQQFKEYFKRDGEEIGASEEDEEGLVASGSTSEGNVSGTDENKSESEATAPVKKKSAYSMAPNRVSCPFCSRKFPWSSSLRRHILTHTGQKPFKCSHCPLLFTTKSNCDRHLLRKHGNNATTISNTADNNNFLMRNVPERPFKCSSCPSSTFSTYSNLKKHISCKHSEDVKGYEAGSSEDEKLTVEETATPTVQNSDLPFKCHLCEGSFGERQDALDHIRDKHYSEYELLMSKNALDANATTPEDAHHEDDEGDLRGKFPDYSNRKVICAFCMRRFWSAEDLRRHMRTHTGERPFSCDICRRRFTLKHSMLRHRKKHNVSFDNEVANSDEDGEKVKKEESDGNEGSDLISNLLGIRDRSFIDKVLTASADDAAKLLGVKNGMKE